MICSLPGTQPVDVVEHPRREVALKAEAVEEKAAWAEVEESRRQSQAIGSAPAATTCSLPGTLLVGNAEHPSKMEV